jgi:hypothetical protein
LLGGVVDVGEVAVGLDSGVLDVNHYAFVDWNNSLVGWWRGEGNALDESGNENNGTWNGTESYIPGKFGQVMEFNGIDQRIYLGNPEDLRIDNNFSISVYVKANVIDDFKQGIFHKEGGWTGYSISIQDSKFRFFTTSTEEGNKAYSVYSNVITKNQWYHVVAVYNGTHNLIYINGNFVNNVIAKYEKNVFSVCYIGWGGYNPSSSSNYFNGSIDEVMIFNRALSADEVKSLYDAKVNQYQNNFTNLTGGDYSFRGYAVDVSGNKYETELREFVCVE